MELYAPSLFENIDDSSIAIAMIEQYNTLAALRGNFETHWQEITERIWPNLSRTFQNRQVMFTQGEKRTSELFDSTGAVALNRFSAILDSLLTPRNQIWHRIVPSNPYLNKIYNVRLWCEEATRIIFKYRYSPNANFASQNQQSYKSVGAFGTGSLFVDALVSEPGIRYRNIHLAELYLQENHQGMIDTALRHFALTARQATQKWPDTIPPEIKEIAKHKPETQYFFLHRVAPREDYDPTRKDYKGMKFASHYISMTGAKVLSEGGYHCFPYATSRYEQAPSEVYGRSPAMDVLPSIKTLNEEKKTMLKQGHKALDPVLLAHDDGLLDGFSLKPGAVNYGGVTADGRPLVHPLPVGDIAAGKELMDDERNLINDAFLVTIFQILVESPQMTATEVMERAKEKSILLAPTIGRQQSEYLGPMIERELDILVRQRLLPPMPPELVEAKGEYHLEYDSPLTRAQRAEEASGLMRTLESALNVVNITRDPSPLDFFNWDVIMPAISDIQGVPPSWMRTLQDVQAIRQQRAQAQQTQTAIQAAPGVSALIKAGAVAKQANNQTQ